MSNQPLRKIGQQTSIAQELDVPRDIRGIISDYISESIPEYRDWARQLWNGYMTEVVDDRLELFNEEKVIERIVHIFIDDYGTNIGKLIDNIKNGQEENIRYINRAEVVNDIQNLFNFKFHYNRDPNYNDDDYFLEATNILWSPYQDPFMKQIFGEGGLTMNLLDIELSMDSEEEEYFLGKIERAWKLGLNPFEIDPITGQSFMRLILDQRLEFMNSEQRKQFESLLLEMLDTIDINEKLAPPEYKYEGFPFIFIMLDNADYDEAAKLDHGWSSNFIYDILKKMDISQLDDQDKSILKTRIKKFKSKSIQKKLLDLLHL